MSEPDNPPVCESGAALTKQAACVFPEHITRHFCPDVADKLTFVRDTLAQRRFDCDKDRAIVFVATRDDAEKYAADFGTYPADYYHAGRSGDDKNDITARFKEGKIAVLFATKAFGMGVDISNIRYVFHMTPPAGLEDYIQEIGRAGRDRKAADAFLPYIEDDFKKVRARTLRSSLRWDMVRAMHTALADYRKSLAATEPDVPPTSFVVPADLIATKPALNDGLFRRDAAATRQRMLLHNLEEAGRLTVGDFELTHWPVRLGHNPSASENSKTIRALAADKGATPDQSALLSERDVRRQLELENDAAARDALFDAARLGAISIPFEIGVEWTRAIQNGQNTPSIEFIVNLLEQAQGLFKPLLAAGFLWKFTHSNIYPEYLNDEPKKKQHRAANGVAVFFDERKVRLLRFLRRLPGVHLKNDPSAHEYRVFLTDNDSRSFDGPTWRETLEALPGRARRLVDYLRESKAATQTIDALYKAADPRLNQMRFGDLELTLHYLVALGIVRLQNDLIPVSVRLDLSNFDHPFDTAEDEVARDLLGARNRMRLWRLNALHVLTRIPEKSAQETFAKNFFLAASQPDAAAVVLEKAGAVAPDLKDEFSGAELLAQYNTLTHEQQAVVRAAQTKNVLVEAGPGTGKTHTLITCVVQRLIALDDIARNAGGPMEASRLLVLAYTRAVVEEVRQRMEALLLQSGRKETVRVYTFHSYAFWRLEQAGIRDIAVADAIDQFNEVFGANGVPLKEPPGHVFVDEFQDITNERYEMLQILSRGTHLPLVTAIGDPYQSIFDYGERVAGERPDWFERFRQDFEAHDLALTINHRCDKDILEEAETLFPRGLHACETAEKGEVERLSVSEALADYVRRAVTSSDRFRQTAVLFRTNGELYEKLPDLKRIADATGAKLRVLGSRSNIPYSREVNETLETLKMKYPDQPFRAESVADAQKSLPTEFWNADLLQGVVEAANLYEQDMRNGHHKRVEDFIEWVRQDKSSNSPLYSFLQSAGRSKPEIILSTVHRSKGLEFDSVILASSAMGFGIHTRPEETRLRYVAITRARHRLFLINGAREQALLKSKTAWQMEYVRGAARRFDTVDKTGAGAFQLSVFSQFHDYIRDKIREGDELRIADNQLWHKVSDKKSHKICDIADRRLEEFSGLPVGGIFVNEILRRDGFGGRNGETQYLHRYHTDARKRGWYYIVNAAGYLRPESNAK